MFWQNLLVGWWRVLLPPFPIKKKMLQTLVVEKLGWDGVLRLVYDMSYFKEQQP